MLYKFSRAISGQQSGSPEEDATKTSRKLCVFVLSKNCVREGMRWAEGKWQVSGSNPLAGVGCSIHKAVLCAIGC
jgi:hypothetical protein